MNLRDGLVSEVCDRRVVSSLAVVAVVATFTACLPTGRADALAQPHVAVDPNLDRAWARAHLARAGDPSATDGNRLGDTPTGPDDDTRSGAQLASAAGMLHINEAARRVRYNGVYFEIDVEVDGQRGIVPVVWGMVRAHTPLDDGSYYARVYTSRGWASGRQVPYSGPIVILPEAFTPELTPVIFEYLKPAFVSWNHNFNGWTQAMSQAWLKTAAIHVTRMWTPELVGGVAVTAARARISGQLALGAAAVPGAAAATRACAGGRCPCFVAGTPVATAHGPLAIERVAVGQRVLPASPACGAIVAGSLTEYHLQIRGADGDMFAIQLLRGRDWPQALGARPGDVVYVELDELNVRGPALVIEWKPDPSIDMDDARGCLVTGTVSHLAKTLSFLRLVDEDEPLVATPWHRLYSDTRGDWVAVEDLAAGELLRTAEGTVAVESVVELDGQREPVFNLEIAGSHRYLVHARRVLTHNTYGSARGIPHGFRGFGQFRQFSQALRGGLKRAGFDDVQPFFLGSAVTGRSFRTRSAFDAGRISDFDIALASPTLLARARALGVSLRSGGTRTGPLTAAEVHQLGLSGVQARLSRMAGRPVNFMVFGNAAAAAERGPHIRVP